MHRCFRGAFSKQSPALASSGKKKVTLPAAPLVVTVQASHEEDPIWIETWSSESGVNVAAKSLKKIGAQYWNHILATKSWGKQ